MRFGGGGQDGGNGHCNDGRWKGGGQDVLKSNVLSKVVSKVLVDEGVLGGCWEKVFFFVLMVLGLIGGDVGKDVETNNWGRGDRSTGDDISGAVGDVEEGVVLRVVEDRPGELRGWGMWDRDNG